MCHKLRSPFELYRLWTIHKFWSHLNSVAIFTPLHQIDSLVRHHQCPPPIPVNCTLYKIYLQPNDNLRSRLHLNLRCEEKKKTETKPTTKKRHTVKVVIFARVYIFVVNQFISNLLVFFIRDFRHLFHTWTRVYCKSGNFRAQLFSQFADFELFHLFLNSRF